MKHNIPFSRRTGSKNGPRKITLLITFFTVLLVALFVYLGFWQLGRWQEKKSLLTKFENRIKEPVLLGTSELLTAFLATTETNPIQEYRYRRLAVSGVLLNNNNLLLDNQIHNKQVGFRIFTPLLTTDHKILLLDRGWVPLGKDRKVLPIILPQTGKVTVTGMIQIPNHGLVLPSHSKQSSNSNSSQSPKHQPQIIQTIDFKALSSSFDSQILPFILQLEPTQTLSFLIPPPTFGIPASRHLGYAVQWFGLALAALIYYLAIGYQHRRRLHKGTTG